VREFYAHTLAGKPKTDWEPLARHLEEVGASASAFADAFGGGAWAGIIGRCHDLGKASKEFQNYLRLSSPEAADAGIENAGAGRLDHSTYGARYVARELAGPVGQLMAFCIAGHHAGLPDESSDDDAKQGGTLRRRLDPACVLIHDVKDPGLELTAPCLPFKLGEKAEFQLAFFTRMLFSCLVDADRTCTEEFCSPETASERSKSKSPLQDLQSCLDSFLERKGSESADTPVNTQRRHVLAACRTASSLAPGFFSLNVPTGGGKTLSSLAFALDHALHNGLRRVVFAIPFTSIIEQAVDVYREALEPCSNAVVEHHTNIRPEHDTRANQFAAENWDAPVIVTTNVQLFESLFAAATTPARKLHRLARSIIVLDEAQTIPVHLLEATLAALRELVLHYGCSVVLCTATQPALERRDDFPIGIDGVRPIIPDPTSLFEALKRVQVKTAGRLPDDELAARLLREPSVLCIVNTRKHAARLFERVAKESDPNTCFHLSTYMCGRHRREVLEQIRTVVKSAPCRVISTQVVEAGVDLDFPVVYRAAAGLDSIAQAAGRCNREGRMPLGYTYVFDAEEPPPPGLQRDATQKADELRNSFEDPISPEAIKAYFKLYYWSQQDLWDKKKIMSNNMMWLDRNRGRAVLQFRQIETAYKVIDDRQLPILVPYQKEGQKFRLQLLNGSVDFIPHRQLQPYLVSMPQGIVRELESRGIVQVHDSGVWVLLRADAYDVSRGLDPERVGLDPELWGV